MNIDPANVVQMVVRWGKTPVGTKAVFKNRQWIVVPLTLEAAEMIPEGRIPLIEILPSTPVTDLYAAIRSPDLKKIISAALEVSQKYHMILNRFENLGSNHAIVLAPANEVYTEHEGNNDVHLEFLKHREKVTGMAFVGC